MNKLVVFSGGMDSTVLLYYVKAIYRKHKIGALSFDYGSKHNKKELFSAENICSLLSIEHTILDISSAFTLFKSDLLLSGGTIPEGHYEHQSMKKTVVPFRNGIMLSIAAGFADSNGYDDLYLGAHSGDHAIYKDCRDEFYMPIKEAIKKGTDNAINVIMPFIRNNKTEICRLGYELGVPYELTYSCYNGSDKHCGKCGTCNERKEAFKDAELIDATDYES